LHSICRKIDALEEVVTYLGAQEGIVMAMIAFCNRGDEVQSRSRRVPH
jgi:aspartate/methionine/tyrosine aminotransferase